MCAENKFSKAKKLLGTSLELMNGLFEKDTISFIDKGYAVACILLSYASLKTGDRDEAVDLIKKTVYYTKRFHSAPNYGIGGFVFDIPEGMSVLFRDILGDSAELSMKTMLKFINDPEINELWDYYYKQ